MHMYVLKYVSISLWVRMTAGDCWSVLRAQWAFTEAVEEGVGVVSGSSPVAATGARQ